MPEDVRVITRAMPIVPNTYNAETHSVTCRIFSGDPVTIWDPERWEVVREYVRMDGVQIPEGKQIPLLDCHERGSIFAQLGSIRNCRRSGDGWDGDIYFDATEDGQKAEMKVRDGHVTDVSAGYNWIDSSFIAAGQKANIEGTEYEGPCRVTRACKLREGSLTPIGADARTKIRSEQITPAVREMLKAEGLRADASEAEAFEFLQNILKRNNPAGNGPGEPNNNQQRKEISMPDQPLPTPVDPKEAVRLERIRATEIDAIVSAHRDVKEIDVLRNEAIEKDWTPEKFGNEVLKRKGTQALDTSRDDGSQFIGMSTKDIKEFSLVRAMRQIITDGQLGGKEREANEAMRKLVDPNRSMERSGFRIPPDVLYTRMDPVRAEFREQMMAKRAALSVAEYGYGGALVGTEMLGGSMIELLRNMPIVAQLGARTLTGLTGNVAIPKQTGGATAYWLSSSGSSTPTRQATAQLSAVPHRLVAETAYEKELLFQSSIDVENFVREDLMAVLSLEKDRAALQGLGSAGEPLGIFNLTGRSTDVSFGGAATLAKTIEFETNVASSKALKGQCAYLVTPAVRGKWKGISKASNYPSFLWETGPNGSGIVNGYRAEASLQMPSNNYVLFGNWNDFIFFEWAGIDVVVDTVTLASYGQVRVVITLWADMGARHPASFCASSDTGAA